MRRALVLSGGGSRGAYEIGAWQALDELGVSFQAVYGTSIGAINAGLVAQGDLGLARELWQNISIKQIIATEDEDFSVDHMVSNKRDVIPFLLENAKYLQADITPLENLMKKYLDERRVRASGLGLGVMTVRAPQLERHPMRLKDMEEGSLTDWLLASAACFPVFPTRKIKGEKYVDGGYYDNLPIDMAIEDGAEEIIAVDLHPQSTHPEYDRMPFLKMIQPLHSLGGFLDFNPRLMRRGRLLGYCDAMKAFGACDGIRYTFRHEGELKTARAARGYMGRVMRFDSEAITRQALRSSAGIDAPLMSRLGAETPLKTLTWKEAYLRGLELCAQAMGFREDALYDAGDLTARMLQYARAGEAVSGIQPEAFQSAAAAGSRALVCYLYRALRAPGEVPAGRVEMLSEYPDETAAALYLITAEQDG